MANAIDYRWCNVALMCVVRVASRCVVYHMYDVLMQKFYVRMILSKVSVRDQLKIQFKMLVSNVNLL